ncbi:thiamine phosphate synthase [Zophobihabitans entericus]|uniref:Thiamine-phosphate synthase n=2 Tax=Zophobihabitans entericus TaxID=1635327 RepID=A0A6G9IF82_9GAMM|nr:thiamine phosphate synthase [Zophobihabitans entericus]
MKKQLDLSLYLVLDPVLCGGIEGMVRTTDLAVKNGVTAVQLRSEHSLNRKQWYEAGLALKQLLSSTSVPLFINDQVDVALAVDADGVHVGQSDLPVDVVRRLIGADKFLGLSVSNLAELNNVPWNLVDYLGIGPVFPTTSKTNAAPALGVAGLQTLVAQKCCPAVAIGGINSSNLAPVVQTGVEGVAVVSAICGQVDIAQVTKQLMTQISGAK